MFQKKKENSQNIKMVGENNGKPYENGWFGGTIIFGNTHMQFPYKHVSYGKCLPTFTHACGYLWHKEKVKYQHPMQQKWQLKALQPMKSSDLS